MSGTYLELKDRTFGCKMLSYRPKQKANTNPWKDPFQAGEMAQLCSPEDQGSDPTSPLLCLPVSEAGRDKRVSGTSWVLVHPRK